MQEQPEAGIDEVQYLRDGLKERDAEIERLRTELQEHNDAIWIGLERAKDVRNATIEECARVAEEHGNQFAADAIRALKS